MGSAGPLTLGTAGHVDHGKTTLVAALTGVETDRLPEEKARGLTIALGYAPLRLPSGRELSLIDVPGHERFVRTMVSGASGIDLYLMTIAADDGVMPQTREHAEVLRALGISAGVVAITKADVADPAAAAEAARELLPDAAAVVPVAARTGAGLERLRAALDALAATLPSRAAAPGPARLHVDRVFTVVGRGTVVTGTLWSGTVDVGDELEIAPRGTVARVRGLEIHDRPVARAEAGQRVAVNLAGVRTGRGGDGRGAAAGAGRGGGIAGRGAAPGARRGGEIARGDALCAPGALRATTIVDCALTLRDAAHGQRVQVHHGTRDAPGRLAALGDDLWQLRLERPLLARAGDRLVIRRLAPPDTLGGGVVLDPAAGRHGRRPEIVARLRALRDGEPDPGLGTEAAVVAEPEAPADAARAAGAPADTAQAAAAPADAARAAGAPAAPAPLDAAARALAERLRAAGASFLSEAQLSQERAALRALREAGVAVRVSGRLYGDAEVVAAYAARIVELLERDGEVRLAGVRDALGIGRKSAQALLEHLDARGVTRREPDDRRVPRRREPIA